MPKRSEPSISAMAEQIARERAQEELFGHYEAAVRDAERARREPKFRVLTVTGSYGKKISDGNYGAFDVFASMTAEVLGGDPAKVHQALVKACKAACMQEAWETVETYREDWPQR